MNPWELALALLGWVVLAVVALLVGVFVLSAVIAIVKQLTAPLRRAREGRGVSIIDAESGVDGRGGKDG